MRPSINPIYKAACGRTTKLTTLLLGDDMAKTMQEVKAISFVKVGRGVLQGDSLSPLNFSFCFNTFIRSIAAQKFQQFGFGLKSLYPIHWFQFAEDAAVITGLENENQILPNHFTQCNWAGMIIRVDKCLTFGIKKAATSSIQYFPKLIFNNFLVPPVR